MFLPFRVPNGMNRLLPVAASFALIACGPGSFVQREERTYRESIDGEGAQEAKAIIRMGAGEMRISGGAAKLLEADIRTSGDRPKIRYDAGTRGRLEIEQEGVHIGNGNNDWDLRLSNKIPLDLEVHLGAGEARIDLGDTVLRSLVIHMGAGELNLDLLGNYTSDVDVEIHGGVGEANIRVPKDMQIEAEVTGGLGDIQARGLEHDDKRYHTPGKAGAARMTLEVHGGIGHIGLDAQ
jgi:hypothetical protein